MTFQVQMIDTNEKTAHFGLQNATLGTILMIKQYLRQHQVKHSH